MTSLNIKEDEFEPLVLEAEALVLVDFWATWCGPCKMLSPILDRFAANTTHPIVVMKVDIEESAAIAQRYGIKSVPTLMIFEKGEIRSTKRGMMSERQLDKWVGEILSE